MVRLPIHHGITHGPFLLHRSPTFSRACSLLPRDPTPLSDLGLAKILRPRDLLGDNVYKMTGNTGSMRYFTFFCTALLGFDVLSVVTLFRAVFICCTDCAWPVRYALSTVRRFCAASIGQEATVDTSNL